MSFFLEKFQHSFLFVGVSKLMIFSIDSRIYCCLSKKLRFVIFVSITMKYISSHERSSAGGEDFNLENQTHTHTHTHEKMESVVQLWSDWEIQLLMILSFTLQMLLFFTGGLRRCSTKALVRFCLWIAYLGADMVALYALGYLSRHQDVIIGGSTLREVHPLFLMHLGGQDTITAFAIEDNNLWLRHLLNLGVQVALTLYVFWKSVDRHNVHILIPGIFLFVAGIIKYGERTLALMQ